MAREIAPFITETDGVVDTPPKEAWAGRAGNWCDKHPLKARLMIGLGALLLISTFFAVNGRLGKTEQEIAQTAEAAEEEPSYLNGRITEAGKRRDIIRVAEYLRLSEFNANGIDFNPDPDQPYNFFVGSAHGTTIQNRYLTLPKAGGDIRDEDDYEDKLVTSYVDWSGGGSEKKIWIPGYELSDFQKK